MYPAVMWLALAMSAPAADLAHPQVLDPRLQIELFAAEPDVRTPIGIAVDARGRVLAIESHTHFRPQGYEGPPADRIQMYEDTDADGRADRITTFFEGTRWTMNLGIHPDGSVYVATRSEIFRLRDTDGDGRADERVPVVRLETKGDYPHNGLSGFAFDFDGTVYFGLGENLGLEFKLVGTDGSLVSELEGGQIYRCRPDGTNVEMVAFGFWNPFHLAFDAFGRLFAVDNDPDSLPPCRLMHIVPGGNYGYRYRNGRKGVHPFTAWNGELPGTLPMVAGTGEAPSGIVAYESDNLPADYVGDLLSTSWGDHRIERFRLERRGASFRSTAEAIVKGDEDFRPVGIAIAPDGSLYVSDWVLKSYEVHGKGRIWHLRAAQTATAARPSGAAAMHAVHRPLRDEAARRLAADPKASHAQLEKLAASDPSTRVRALAISALSSAKNFRAARRAARDDSSIDVQALAFRNLGDEPISAVLQGAKLPPEVLAEVLRHSAGEPEEKLLWKEVSSNDAFIAQAARQGLARSGLVFAKGDANRPDPVERLATLLILRETRAPSGRSALPAFLRDADSNVRFAAIQWVGEERLTAMQPSLIEALAAGPATARLFGGYLAALERLDGVVRRSDDEWAGEQYIVLALNDPRTTAEVRRWSLRMLRADHPFVTIDRLRQFVASDDPLLQLEAVRTLRDCPHAERFALLREIAGGTQFSALLRAEAVVGLSGDDAETRALLVLLATSAPGPVAEESLRSLRGSPLSDQDRGRLTQILHAESRRGELVARILDPAAPPTFPGADELAAWLKLLVTDDATPGNAAAGERIFFHARSAACSRCHQVTGRGNRVGPELTAAAGTLSRERLIESIVRPSKEIAPQFSSWVIHTSSGKSLLGMLVKEEATGEQTYADEKGQLHRFAPHEIESRKAQNISIMPEGLPRLLTLGEFRDLLAFLQSQRAAN